jgi:hypothetical protein
MLFMMSSNAFWYVLPVFLRVLRLLILTAFAACLVPGALGQDDKEGNRRMAERLEKITREASPWDNLFANEARITILRERLASAENPFERVQLRGQLATELMNAGPNLEAAREFAAIEAEARQRGVTLNRRDRMDLRIQEAIAWLRLGEQENCRESHSPDSCIIPIAGGGVHRERQGSERARDILVEHLRQFPQDLVARWLLNIAAMTLGEYPGGVPVAQRIPEKAFAAKHNFPRFPDVAEQAGLAVDEVAGGTIVDDFDGDGLLDVVFSSWHWEGQLRFFRNGGNGRFVERTEEAGLAGLVGGLNIIQADYNNDGRLDIFVPRGAWLGSAGLHPNSLLRNNGNGTFTDVTEEAGLLSFRPTQTAVWFDFDNDGWLDLFVGNESTLGATIGSAAGGAQRHPCELFRNNGDGTFTECAAAAGLDVVSFVKGAVADDFNNDGRMDLYLSCLGSPNMLFRNDGSAKAPQGQKFGWKFTEVGKQAGVQEPLHSFPVWFFDYDNDGWVDIFAAGYTNRFGLGTTRGVVADFLGMPSNVQKARLFRNNGDGTFTDASAETGLDRVLYGMGANFGDLDNDGWLDLYIGTGDPNLGNLVPNLAFRNADGKQFQDVTTAGGFGHLQKGHGIAFADLNNDGGQEVVANLGGAYTGDNYRNAVFANPGNTSRWLKLELQGAKSNRSAIGARIKVTVRTPAGDRTIFRTVHSGGSFGASPLRQEIGLGNATEITGVEIVWPATRQPQRLLGLRMNSFYRIREGQADPAPVSLKSFEWPPAPEKHSHSAH